MSRSKPLTTLTAKTVGPGIHGDGGCLFLRVRETGQRSWVFRFQRGGRLSNGGKATEIGLGGLSQRSLKDARAIATAMRAALASNGDPASVLGPKRDANGLTFKSAALELIEAKRSSWKSEKTGKLWLATLEQYAFESIGSKRPSQISLDDIEAILKPLWKPKAQGGKLETATKLRVRIESVIDYAITKERIVGHSNPARWVGNLEHVGFAEPNALAKPDHHPAAEFKDVPAIMSVLRTKDFISAFNLRWTILTAARSGESRAATWNEIRESERMWAIPAARMKGGRDHNVPLNDEAMEILEKMRERKSNSSNYIFPGERGGLLTDVAVNKTLHAINPNISVHGFRSSFRQWGAVALPNQREALELSLAHANRNKIEATYQRNDLFEPRIEIMKVWGDFVRNGKVFELARAI